MGFELSCAGGAVELTRTVAHLDGGYKMPWSPKGTSEKKPFLCEVYPHHSCRGNHKWCISANRGYGEQGFDTKGKAEARCRELRKIEKGRN